ncbi:hypothetical protein D3C75_919630 [compost metagenome]
MFDGLDPADAAAGGAGEAALALAQSGEATVGDGHIEHHTLLGGGCLDVVHILITRDDAVAEQETYGEIIEIVGGHHHDGMVDAVDID